jgi:hypothetical protein
LAVDVSKMLLDAIQKDRQTDHEGRKEWNEWRKTNPHITAAELFLRMASLNEYDLRGLKITGKTSMVAGVKTISAGSFEGALLKKTNLCGADISKVNGLTPKQLAGAEIDASTVLPSGITLQAIAAARSSQPAAASTPKIGWEQILAERAAKTAAGAVGPKRGTVTASELGAMTQAVEAKIAEGKDKDSGKKRKEKDEKLDPAEVAKIAARFNQSGGSSMGGL